MEPIEHTALPSYCFPLRMLAQEQKAPQGGAAWPAPWLSCMRRFVSSWGYHWFCPRMPIPQGLKLAPQRVHCLQQVPEQRAELLLPNTGVPRYLNL